MHKTPKVRYCEHFEVLTEPCTTFVAKVGSSTSRVPYRVSPRALSVWSITLKILECLRGIVLSGSNFLVTYEKIEAPTLRLEQPK